MKPATLTLLLLVLLTLPGKPDALAAPVAVEICQHVATADTIRVYYCEDSGMFVNQLGFMVFEP